jgi:hypothetical protein
VATLFEFLDAINTGKALTLDDSMADPYKDYVPFQINNGMCQNLDTVLIANEMNKRPWLSKEMQFKFYNGAVSKKKRYGKWAKVEELANKDDVATVSEYYDVNEARALEYIRLLTPDHIAQMKVFLNKGGQEGGKPKATKAKK